MSRPGNQKNIEQICIRIPTELARFFKEEKRRLGLKNLGILFAMWADAYRERKQNKGIFIALPDTVMGLVETFSQDDGDELQKRLRQALADYLTEKFQGYLEGLEKDLASARKRKS